MTIGGHNTSPADGLHALGDIPSGDSRVEGLTEYTAQDAIEASDGEESRTGRGSAYHSKSSAPFSQTH